MNEREIKSSDMKATYFGYLIKSNKKIKNAKFSLDLFAATEKVIGKELSQYTEVDWYTAFEIMISSGKFDKGKSFSPYLSKVQDYLDFVSKQKSNNSSFKGKVLDLYRKGGFEEYVRNNYSSLKITRKQLYEEIKNNILSNSRGRYEDICICILLFEGLRGKNCKYLRYLEVENIEYDDKYIRVVDPLTKKLVRNLPLSDEALTIIRETISKHIQRNDNVERSTNFVINLEERSQAKDEYKLGASTSAGISTLFSVGFKKKYNLKLTMNYLFESGIMDKIAHFEKAKGFNINDDNTIYKKISKYYKNNTRIWSDIKNQYIAFRKKYELDALITPESLNDLSHVIETIDRVELTALEKSNIYDKGQAGSSNSAFLEGEEKVKLHKEKERKPELIRKAKELFKENNGGNLFCEACGESYVKKYGKDYVDTYIEGHHKKPIFMIDESEEMMPEDIMMVCALCHAIIHKEKKRALSFNEIRTIIEQNESI